MITGWLCRVSFDVGVKATIRDDNGSRCRTSCGGVRVGTARSATSGGGSGNGNTPVVDVLDRVCGDKYDKESQEDKDRFGCVHDGINERKIRMRVV